MVNSTGIAPKWFWERVNKTESCWLWTGRLNAGGYGVYSVWLGGGRKNGKVKVLFAHRVSWEIHRGDIPEGLVIDHLCRVRNCVNPSHCEVVSSAENILRGVGAHAKNAIKTHCDHGHEFNDANTHVVIRKDGQHRVCRICKAANCRKWYYRNKAKAAMPAIGGGG